jgi:hypothetical protein
MDVPKKVPGLFVYIILYHLVVVSICDKITVSYQNYFKGEY